MDNAKLQAKSWAICEVLEYKEPRRVGEVAQGARIRDSLGREEFEAIIQKVRDYFNF